jgi:hypothetical protein
VARKKTAFPKQILVCKEQDGDSEYLVAVETADELPVEAQIIGLYELRNTATVARKVEIKFKGK